MALKYFEVAGELQSFPDDGSLDDLITQDMVALTDEEVQVLRETASLALQALVYDRETLRAAAYRTEADPLFFKSQRGEATHEEWIAKVDEIRARFP